MIALDLGTRSVVALDYDADVIRRFVVAEHSSRAMREGRVRDMKRTIETLEKVHRELKLEPGAQASIALAGRDLHTKVFTVSLNGPGPWSAEDLDNAERAAFAQYEDRPAGDLLLGVYRGDFFVDNLEVDSAVGMEGDRAEYRAMATFLPAASVRQKVRAVEEAGFVPVWITAEPLAILEALFGSTPPPGTYAIVDIGAGTSDIALHNEHGLMGVASVPVAGDAITEEIGRKFGLEYLEADRIKRNQSAVVTDAWGEEVRIESEDIEKAARPAVVDLARAIAERIESLFPKAAAGGLSGVVLVGGGAQWSDVPVELASALSLPADRVRLRTVETIRNIKCQQDGFAGTPFVTAAGIMKSRDVSFRLQRFTVDGKNDLAALAPGSPHTAAEVLEASGREPCEFFGDPGEAEISGEEITAGEPGEPPLVEIDGVRSSLDSEVAIGAKLVISKGRAGKPAGASSAPEIATEENNPASPIEPALSVAETATEAKNPVAPVEPAPPASAPEKISAPAASVPADESIIRFKVDGEEFEVPADEWDEDTVREFVETGGYVSIEGQKVYCGERYRVVESDSPMTFETVEVDPPLVESVVDFPLRRSIKVLLNGKEIEVRDRTLSVRVNGEKRDKKSSAPWDAEIDLARGPWRLYEILPETSSPLAVKLLRNGETASFDTVLEPDDKVTVK